MVYFYEDKEMNEILTLCHPCAEGYDRELSYIDKAGDWDICSNCEKQNLPENYPYPYGSMVEENLVE